MNRLRSMVWPTHSPIYCWPFSVNQARTPTFPMSSRMSKTKESYESGDSEPLPMATLSLMGRIARKPTAAGKVSWVKYTVLSFLHLLISLFDCGLCEAITFNFNTYFDIFWNRSNWYQLVFFLGSVAFITYMRLQTEAIVACYMSLEKRHQV